MTIEFFNEITQTIEEVKPSTLIIESPIDLILWGTIEKWINDPTITPAAFKAADVIMLNSRDF
jgi:hypothetical protein